MHGLETHHRGFTLIELILVMAVLTIAVSLTAPALGNFFRGRTLDSEGRRLLSLTRQGQSRAVAEGVPMELWFDPERSEYGLEAERSYELTDAKAVTFTLDRDLQLDVGNFAATSLTVENPSAASQRSSHPNLPVIRFLSDGTITESSPERIKLTGRDGHSLWVVLSRNGLGYEIQNRVH